MKSTTIPQSTSFRKARISPSLLILFLFHLILPAGSWGSGAAPHFNKPPILTSDLRKQGLALDRQIEALEQKIQESQVKNQQVYQSATSVIQGEVSPDIQSFDIAKVDEDGFSSAKRPIRQYVKPGVVYAGDVNDPIEGFNRLIYKFNAKFDQYVFLPATAGYEFITPDFLEDMISNIFSNISEIRNLMNALFQLKFETSGNILVRFLVNSTFGLGGLWDHATPLGFPQQVEDFGQTLGHYGVSNGPYIVLPIFGPSNLRDTTGLVVDSAARFFYLVVPTGLDDNLVGASAYTLMNAIDTRHRLDFRYYETGSPFEYDLVRWLYTEKRLIDIAK